MTSNLQSFESLQDMQELVPYVRASGVSKEQHWISTHPKMEHLDRRTAACGRPETAMNRIAGPRTEAGDYQTATLAV